MTFHKLSLAVLTVAVVLSLSLAGCAGPAPEATGPFKVLISSDVEFLKPTLEKALQDAGIESQVTVGAKTIEMADSVVRAQEGAPDAIVVTGTNWLPDTYGASVISSPETIAWSPVVIGFKPGTASGAAIPLNELLTIVTKNPKSILAAQGNGSDASVLFWLGALSAKSGSGTINEGQIRTPELNATFEALTRGIVQVEETSGPLLKQAQSSLDKLKGVVTYEAAIRQMNQQLDAEKKPKLVPTRLQGGTLSGTITIALVGKSEAKQKTFQSVVTTLKEAATQKAIQETGWLTAAPSDVLAAPLRGTLWATKRRFEQSTPKLAAQTTARP